MITLYNKQIIYTHINTHTYIHTHIHTLEKRKKKGTKAVTGVVHFHKVHLCNLLSLKGACYYLRFVLYISM